MQTEPPAWCPAPHGHAGLGVFFLGGGWGKPRCCCQGSGPSVPSCLERMTATPAVISGGGGGGSGAAALFPTNLLSYLQIPAWQRDCWLGARARNTLSPGRGRPDLFGCVSTVPSRGRTGRAGWGCPLCSPGPEMPRAHLAGAGTRLPSTSPRPVPRVLAVRAWGTRKEGAQGMDWGNLVHFEPLSVKGERLVPSLPGFGGCSGKTTPPEPNSQRDGDTPAPAAEVTAARERNRQRAGSRAYKWACRRAGVTLPEHLPREHLPGDTRGAAAGARGPPAASPCSRGKPQIPVGF